MNAKEIESLSYGTVEQMEQADLWYSRFMQFAEKRNASGDCLLLDSVWNRIHHNDVWYQARRRWMEKTWYNPDNKKYEIEI